MTVPGDRILIVKLADIGDAVLALPAVQAVRTALPGAVIDVLTTGAGASVFELSPGIDQVITLQKQRFDHIRGLVSPSGLIDLGRLTWQLRSRRYDSVAILHHLTTAFGARKFQALANATGARVVAGLDNGRGTFLTHAAIDYGFGAVPEWRYGLAVVEALGISAVESRPELQVPDSAEEGARSRLRDAGIRGDYAIIHPEVGEFSPARAWPGEYFGEVVDQLVEDYDLPVVLVGTNRDLPVLSALESKTGVHNLVGRTTFPELGALVQGASLVVGCDSSVSHLAGAFGRPAVTLFGPTNIEAWRPFGSAIASAGALSEMDSRAVAVHLEMPCSPCIYTGFRLGRPSGCRSRTCMTALRPEFVTRAVEQVLRQDAIRDESTEAPE